MAKNEKTSGVNGRTAMLLCCFIADVRSFTCLFTYPNFVKLLCLLKVTGKALTPAFRDWAGLKYPDNSVGRECGKLLEVK